MHNKIIDYIENKEGDNFKKTEIGLIPENWEILRLGEECKVFSGYAFKSKDFTSQGVLVVKIGNLQNGTIVIDKRTSFYPLGKLQDAQLGKYILKEGDILIALTGATTGKIAKVPKEFKCSLLNQRVGKFEIFGNRLVKNFARHCFKSSYFQNKIQDCILRSAQGNVSPKQIENLKIPLPTILEQKKISRVLSKIQQAIETQDKIIEAIKNLKKSLMQSLFTEGVINGFMFDTNIFNHILDNKIKVEDFAGDSDFFVTHIQEDELGETPDPDRKNMLLKVFKKIDQENIPTESLVLSVSKLGKAKLGDENGLYKKIKLDLDEKELKQNNEQDALIAKTTIKNGLILVTDDSDLLEVTQKYNGEVITLKGFLSGNYRKLKETEIGLIPENWEVVKLGDIGKIITGTTPSTKKPEYYGGPYMFISPGDITERKYIIKTEKWLSEQGLKVSRSLPKDTVLVVCIGATIGKTAMTKIENCTTNQQINAILPNEDINSEYLYYSLSFFSNKLPNFAGGIGIPIINKSNFKNFKIFLPPSQVQYEIAHILSTIDKKLEVEKSRKSILKELSKTMLNKLMTGEIRLKDIEV